MSHLFGIGLQVECQKINMAFRMQLAKRGSAALKHLVKVFAEIDTNGNGYLDYKEFERGLAALGLFPTKVQLQTLFKVYDKNCDGRISYDEFVSVLREPLEGKRLAVVLRAFESLDPNGNGVVRIDDLFERFNVSESEAFLSGKATKEQLFAICGFEELETHGLVSKADFINLYTDVSMGTESTEQFCEMVKHCWQLDGHSEHVSKQQVTHLVSLIRQKLLSMSGRQSDEYVLRTVFNEFDVNKDGTLNAEELQKLLGKLQITCDQAYIKELIVKFDRNKNGRIEFDEFVQFVIHNPYK